MMRSKNTKSDNLESDFAEILEKTHLLGWNETAKTIRVWADRKRKKVLRAGLVAILFLN